MAALALLSFSHTALATSKPTPPPQILPTIFVHGFAGSAAQYQSQAMRFASNGVPDEMILAFEYNTAVTAGIAGAPAALDAMVDTVRARFGVERVNLVAHSLGTIVSGIYLSIPARAAKISKYIGVDGASNATCGSTAPGTLSCMGIFRGSAGNVGGNNIFFNDTQTHVQSVTSAESFAAQFQFLTGEAPRTTNIVKDHGLIRIAGRVVNFPANEGAAGAQLELWRIGERTGQRLFRLRSTPIAADGNWGPFVVVSGQNYELAVIREAAATGHFYFQPWPRSTNLVRLNVSPAGSAATANTNVSDAHSALVITRQKEWWVNHPSGQNDSLTISTRSFSAGVLDPVEVMTPITDNSRIAIHVHDDAATPTVSSLALLPFFSTQPFQTGVDVFMPAADRTDGIVSIVNAHRGNAARRELQEINIPNWASSHHRSSVSFNDYLQDD
jgi:pimeloyl-ACP methyl ester carboxylesterase